MNESYIKNVVEAALLAAGRPLQIAELAQLFEEIGPPGHRRHSRGARRASKPTTAGAASR